MVPPTTTQADASCDDVGLLRDTVWCDVWHVALRWWQLHHTTDCVVTKQIPIKIFSFWNRCNSYRVSRIQMLLQMGWNMTLFQSVNVPSGCFVISWWRDMSRVSRMSRMSHVNDTWPLFMGIVFAGCLFARGPPMVLWILKVNVAGVHLVFA